MKRFLTVALAVMMLAVFVPTVALADSVSFDDVIVTNYNHSGFPFDPAYASDAYFVTTAPYGDITRSAPPAGTYGVNYMVQFFLSRTLNPDADIVYLNGERIYFNSYNGGRAYIEGSMIVCTFTAQKGGNRQSFQIRISNANDKSYYSKTATMVYRDAATDTYGSYYGSSSDSMWWTGSSSYDETLRVTASYSTSLYTITSSNQTIYIDYNSAYQNIGTQIDVAFTFTDSYLRKIPSSGLGILTNVKSNGSLPFINSSQYNQSYNDRGRFTNALTIPITIDPSNTRVSFEVVANGTTYSSFEYNVVWRDVAQASSSDNLTITPSRTPSIAVGQDYTFAISSNNRYSTGDYFTLDVSGNAGIVSTATGKYLTIRGIAAGTTRLNVRDSWGTILTTIPVTVTASGSTTTAPGTSSTYRVIAQSLNVRTGPGVNYPAIGTTPYGTTLTVNSIQNGWANVQWGNTTAYVSTTYLVYVSGGATATQSSTSTSSSSLTASTSAPYYPYGYQQGALGASATGGTSTSSDTLYSSVTHKIVNVAWTDVLDGPGRGYDFIATANEGDSVQVYSINNGWAQVNWKGTLGYIYAGHLR